MSRISENYFNGLKEFQNDSNDLKMSEPGMNTLMEHQVVIMYSYPTLAIIYCNCVFYDWGGPLSSKIPVHALGASTWRLLLLLESTLWPLACPTNHGEMPCSHCQSNPDLLFLEACKTLYV